MFDFVEGDCDLSIAPLDAAPPDATPAAADLDIAALLRKVRDEVPAIAAAAAAAAPPSSPPRTCPSRPARGAGPPRPTPRCAGCC